MNNIRLSGVEEVFDRLKVLLRELFQLDRGDLDFGLYRILNIKAAEIEAFLERDLLPQVKTVLASVSEGERTALALELAEARESARTLGFEPDAAPRVIELQQRLSATRADTNAEADVYGHLVNFFGRYYLEGDFMSLRRYTSGSRGSYLIPYNGEEVKLHWANADQYYIKTADNYATYAFTVVDGENAGRVRFEIADADNEKRDNFETNGKQRRFVLAQQDVAVTYDDEDLVIRFEHRQLSDAEQKMWPGNGTRQQDRINETSSTRLFDTLKRDWSSMLGNPAPTQANPERTILEKHIGRYTAKNSFDYFVHKDLNGFMHRELELYLKTDVLNLEDLELVDEARLRRAVARMHAVRQVGHKIIAFLSQLEDFQKRLWLKKKFVLETNWCVTLDRVPEFLYSEIANNEAQREEWVELFESDDIGIHAESCSEPPSCDFLKANPHLVVDTRNFDWDFKERLLAALSDNKSLDEQTDGLLIHGENFQALNLLQARYRQQVQCIYIDPPYNTGSDEFLYKDSYQHSSWLTMMKDRAELSKSLMDRRGSLYCQIDHLETHRLRELFDTLFTFQREVIWDIQVLSGFKTIAPNWIRGHETILFYTAGQDYTFNKLRQPHTDKYERMFNRTDEHGRKYMVAHGTTRYWDEVKDKGKPIGDVWSDIMSFQQQPTAAERIGFNTQKPEELLERIITSSTSRGETVLDYFGGSGTTAACAQKLDRKYVLCEMGEHFDSFVLPRMKRTLHGEDTAVSRKSGYTGGGMFKYIRLETYDDTLDGLVLTSADEELLAGNQPSLTEDYRLRYALNAETAESLCLLGGDFSDPLSYTLSVVRQGVRREILVDLPETFSFLIGLRVQSRHLFNGVLAVAGVDGQGKGCLVLWRNLETMDNNALERWFAEHRGQLPNSLDLVYVNGDNTLNAIRQPDEFWTAETIEPFFRQLMFEATYP